MELGNIAFGNSRGEFEVPREHKYEFHMERLFDALGCDGYGIEFENEVFSMFPYYWGDCSCGWESIDEGHKKTWDLKHNPDCFNVAYQALCATTKPYGSKSDRESHEKQLRKLYEKFGVPVAVGEYWYAGCASLCTCDYHERYEVVLKEYAEVFGCEGHKPDCLLLKPNLFHKPTGYSLKWYKYALRDAYASEPLSETEFRKMIDSCIESVHVMDSLKSK